MRRMTGKRALIDLLRHEGVKYVFGIPGATEILFMDALEQAPDIQCILGLHEVVCAGMAEGYGRASGKVGFVRQTSSDPMKISLDRANFHMLIAIINIRYNGDLLMHGVIGET